jgi:PPK2 family polyphosphate:nucleotide phosphotransferase
MKKIITNSKICVKNGKGFKLKNYKTNEKLNYKNEDSLKKELNNHKENIAILQEKLYAQNKYSVLLVLQAIDAAGKDSCIKHVLTGVNPQGCEVVSFKQPSKEELSHDFLWRSNRVLPEKGKIAVFNRSYYEELLICKVHPEFILSQNIPGVDTNKQINNKFWESRYDAINAMEKHLVNNGTIIIKVFLNLGKEEQKNRFIERIEIPNKQWKFNATDLQERQHWEAYQNAYEEMIKNTSKSYAPWHIVPADNQWISRAIVGKLMSETLESLELEYPVLSPLQLEELKKAKLTLDNES